MTIILAYPPASQGYDIVATYPRRGTTTVSTRKVGHCRRTSSGWTARLGRNATVTAPGLAQLKVRIGRYFYENGRWWK